MSIPSTVDRVAANGSISRNVPLSNSKSDTSRAVNLPFSCCWSNPLISASKLDFPFSLVHLVDFFEHRFSLHSFLGYLPMYPAAHTIRTELRRAFGWIKAICAPCAPRLGDSFSTRMPLPALVQTLGARRRHQRRHGECRRRACAMNFAIGPSALHRFQEFDIGVRRPRENTTRTLLALPPLLRE